MSQQPAGCAGRVWLLLLLLLGVCWVLLPQLVGVHIEWAANSFRAIPTAASSTLIC
jgi:hypothetical protein